MKIRVEPKVSAAQSILAALAILATMSGCASPAVATAMVPEGMAVDKRHPYAVNVEVAGGRETTAMTASQISDEVFEQAISDALVTSGLFAEVADRNAADYHLDVTIFSIEQPAVGFSMTVKMEVGWTLTQMSSGKRIWRESIRSVYTASAGDAFAGVTRVRLATEGAARKNIKQAIEELSRVDF